MNINTNALLNNLLTKVDSSLKAKIDKLSTDGKVDISTMAKGKGIESLLNDLFKDISTGSKTKTDVNNLLENSKQSLKFKNITSELKQIVNLLSKEFKGTPEIEKLTSLLKTSMVDIKNVDEKILKSNFQNSGVFLESKLATSKESVSTNLKNLLSQLNDKIKILNSIDTSSSKESSTGLKQNTTLTNSLLKDESSSSKVVNTNLKEESILDKLSTPQKDVGLAKQQNISTQSTSEPRSNLQNEVKNTTLVETNTYTSKISKLFSEIKNDLSLQKVLNLSSEVKSDVKLDVQNILKKVESLPQLAVVDKQLNILQTVNTDIRNLEQKFVKLDIKNDVTLNLKELAQQAKNNILNNTNQALDKSIILVKNQLENMKSTNLTEIKTDVKNIESKIEKLHIEKAIEPKTAILKEIIQNTSNTLNKIDMGNIKELLKNNISELKNISGDLKTIMLQVKEVIEQSSNSESTSKEIKTAVDKVLSQIDYYQLSSYSSNSNHSYLSFLQDDVEDVDIKFNNVDDEFSCLIHLSLKEKGDLKILLQLDKNSSILINIGVEKNEFKTMIQDALQTLRIQINSLGLSISDLNIFDLDEETNKSPKLNAYSDNQNLDFGVDIKV